MRYRKLPLHIRLDDIRAQPNGPEEAERVASAEFVATASTPGFQFVTDVLRHLEMEALQKMIAGTGNTDRLLGRLQCIYEIRKSLESLLPVPERKKVDWHDDPEEDFVLIDPRTRADGKQIADDE